MLDRSEYVKVCEVLDMSECVKVCDRLVQIRAHYVELGRIGPDPGALRRAGTDWSGWDIFLNSVERREGLG